MKDQQAMFSTFLSATPTWKEAGRVLDLGSTFDDYNRSVDPDGVALRMDVHAIGSDLWAALARLRRQRL